LHEFLKPRRHILLEPNPEIFQPYIDPLLELPDSKYRLVVKDPVRLESYEELIDEGAFPDQTRVDSSAPNGQELNKTLLVTGSLVWDPRLPGLGFDSMAKQMYHHFANSAWSNDLFHAFGPVRTLLWVQTEDFSSMIAQASKHMSKSNRLLEMTQDINLVVSSEREERTRGVGAVGREPQHEIESTILALRSAQKKGLVIPEDRKESTHLFAGLVEKASNGSGIMDCKSIYELLHQQHMAGNVPVQYAGTLLLEGTETYMQVKSECPDIPLGPMMSEDKNVVHLESMQGHPKHALFKTMHGLQSRLRGAIKTKVKIEKTADIGEEMLNLEIKALKTKPGPKKDALVEKIKTLDKAWEDSLKTVDRHIITAPALELDDRINLRFPPPRMQWDARPYEPLMSHEDEAWPQTRLGLVLSTPFPRPSGDAPDWHEWVLDFVYGLYRDPAKSVPDALDAMQHSLSAIIEDCPSLTDPDKGGRMQLKHLRVRMCTTEMIFDMVKAYRDWPFKQAGTDHSTYFRHQGLRQDKGRR
jgi:transcription factor 1